MTKVLLTKYLWLLHALLLGFNTIKAQNTDCNLTLSQACGLNSNANMGSMQPGRYPYYSNGEIFGLDHTGAAGSGALYRVQAGKTYEWSTCNLEYNDFDVQLTLFHAGTLQPLCYNDDFCGIDSRIAWTSTFDGAVYVQVSRYNCENTPQVAFTKVDWSVLNPNSSPVLCDMQIKNFGSNKVFCDGARFSFTTGNDNYFLTEEEWFGLDSIYVFYKRQSEGNNVSTWTNGVKTKVTRTLQNYFDFNNNEDVKFYSYTFNLGGLISSSQYQLKVGGACAGAKGSTTNTVSITTTSCALQSNVPDDATAGTGITISWTGSVDQNVPYNLSYSNFRNGPWSPIISGVTALEYVWVPIPKAGVNNQNQAQMYVRVAQASNPNNFSIDSMLIYNPYVVFTAPVDFPAKTKKLLFSTPYSQFIDFGFDRLGFDFIGVGGVAIGASFYDGSGNVIVDGYVPSRNSNDSFFDYFIPSIGDYWFKSRIFSGPAGGGNLDNLIGKSDSIFLQMRSRVIQTPVAGAVICNQSTFAMSFQGYEITDVFKLSTNNGFTWSVITPIIPVTNIQGSDVAIFNVPAGLTSTQCKLLIVNGDTTDYTFSILGSTPQVSGATSQSFCAGSSLTLSVLNPVQGVTYQWSNNQTGTSITVTAGGSYSVRTIASGCTSVASQAVAISVNPIPAAPNIVGSTSQSVCAGSSLTLSVLNPVQGVTYQWSNNQTGTSITVTTAGLYQVRAFIGSCSSAVSPRISVTVTPLPATPTIISVSGNISICSGGSGTLSVSNPQTNTTYLWSNNVVANSITTSTAGTFSVRAVSNGCTSAVSAPVVVTILPLPTTPTISGATSQSICNGSNLTLTVGNPQGNTAYIWSNNGSGTSTTVSSAGSYTVFAINSCTSAVSSPVSVLVNPVPSMPSISGPRTISICEGSATTLSVENPLPSNIYLWSNNAVGSSISVTTAGTFRVRTVANGCTSSLSQMVVVSVTPIPATPGIAGSASQSVCAGTPVTLTVSNPIANNTYVWSNNQTGTSITVTAGGSYSVRTIASGCTSVASQAVAISVNPIPNPPLTIGDTICRSGSGVLQAIGGNTYRWYTAAIGGQPLLGITTGTFSTPVLNVNTTYHVSVVLNNCESERTPVLAFVNTFNNATFSVNGSLLSAVPLTGQFYQWFLNGNPIVGANQNSYQANTSGSYQVQISKDGCSDTSANQMVIVTALTHNFAESSWLVFPNPANDYLNFIGKGIERFHLMDLFSKTVLKSDSPLKSNENIFIGQLPQGIYIIEMQGEGKVRKVKLSIKR